jgi:opacity protein-like surface antigen
MTSPNRFFTLIGVAVAGALAMNPAHADDAQPAAQSVYTNTGAFGVGIGYARRLADHWIGRVQLDSGGLATATGHLDEGGTRYDSRLKTGAGLLALADFYPAVDSGWHVSGGLIVSRIRPSLTGKADSQGRYSLNGHSYSAAEVGTLNGRAKFNPVSPYLGGGWESSPIESKGWRFTSDVGLFYAGKSSTTLSASGAANNPALQADLKAQQSALDRQGFGLTVMIGVAHSF